MTPKKKNRNQKKKNVGAGNPRQKVKPGLGCLHFSHTCLNGLDFLTGLLVVGSLCQTMASPAHIDLTSPRRDEDGLGSTTPRVTPGDTTCTICLGRAFADPAAEPIFTWLICRHPLHLGCVANLRAHNQRPACPSCR